MNIKGSAGRPSFIAHVQPKKSNGLKIFLSRLWIPTRFVVSFHFGKSLVEFLFLAQLTSLRTHRRP